MSEKVETRTAFNIGEMPQAYEAFRGLELVETADGSERWNGIIEYGEGEDKKTHRVPIEFGPEVIWGINPSDREFYDKFPGRWAEMQNLKDRLTALEARSETDDVIAQGQPLAEVEPTPAEAVTVVPAADKDVRVVTPETPPVAPDTAETVANDNEFSIGQTVWVQLENGQVVEGTVASGTWKAPLPDERDYITVFVEGSGPQYIRPDVLVQYQGLALPQPEAGNFVATDDEVPITPADEVLVAPVDATTRETTITTTTEARERRDRRSRLGAAAAIVGAAVLGFLAGSGIVAACDNDDGGTKAVNGSNSYFENSNSGGHGLQLDHPKNTNVIKNQDGTYTFKTASGKSMKLVWNRQGKLTSQTIKSLRSEKVDVGWAQTKFTNREGSTYSHQYSVIR